MTTAAATSDGGETATSAQKLPFAGDTTIAAALKNVEVERIVGPGDQETVKLGSLWQDQPLVLHFLRRFGCRLCRGGALEMSQALPHLREAGVRAAAIGPEPLGLEEFVDSKYWAGEIYVDEGKKAYKALQLKSLGYFQLFQQLFFNAEVKKSLQQTKNVAGNFAGDGMQLGATFIFDKGGALITALKQETPADHFTPEQLLSFFHIDPKVLAGTAKQIETEDTCQKDQCS